MDDWGRLTWIYMYMYSGSVKVLPAKNVSRVIATGKIPLFSLLKREEILNSLAMTKPALPILTGNVYFKVYGRWLTVSLDMSIASCKVDDCYFAFKLHFLSPFYTNVHSSYQNRIVIMLDVKAIVLNSHSPTPQLRMLKWLNSDASINWWQRLWDIPRQSAGPGMLNPGIAGHQIRSIYHLLNVNEFWWPGWVLTDYPLQLSRHMKRGPVAG